MRAGRPRSRAGIFHTTNRHHGLHHAQEWGKAPGSALKNHSPLEGECHPGARASRPQPYFLVEVTNRQRDVAGRLPPCRRERRWPRPNGRDPLEGGLVRIVWGWRGWEAVCGNMDAGGTPAVPGGHLPHDTTSSRQGASDGSYEGRLGGCGLGGLAGCSLTQGLNPTTN